MPVTVTYASASYNPPTEIPFSVDGTPAFGGEMVWLAIVVPLSVAWRSADMKDPGRLLEDRSWVASTIGPGSVKPCPRRVIVISMGGPAVLVTIPEMSTSLRNEFPADCPAVTLTTKLVNSGKMTPESLKVLLPAAEKGPVVALAVSPKLSEISNVSR